MENVHPHTDNGEAGGRNNKYLISGKIHLHKTKTEYYILWEGNMGCSETTAVWSYKQVRRRTTSWLQIRFCFPDSCFEYPVLYFINWLLDQILSFISNTRCISINQQTQSPAFLRHHSCTGGWNQKILFLVWQSVTISSCTNNDQQHFRKGLVAGIPDMPLLWIRQWLQNSSFLQACDIFIFITKSQDLVCKSFYT